MSSSPAEAGRFLRSAHLWQVPLPLEQSLHSRLSPGFESTARAYVLPHSIYKIRHCLHTCAPCRTRIYMYSFCYIYLSRNVRVLAWMMLRSHSAGFLPASACLCPYTSMATAPSVRCSINSSVTDTASSYVSPQKTSAIQTKSTTHFHTTRNQNRHCSGKLLDLLQDLKFSSSLPCLPCSCQTPPCSVGPCCWVMRMTCQLREPR